MKLLRNESGEANGLLIMTVVLSIAVVGLGGATVWSYMNYLDQKDNTDSKIVTAEKIAADKQKKVDRLFFDEEYKKPNLTFAAPADYGSVSFSYPKTWSVYVADDGSSSDAYAAYFQQKQVAPVTSKTPYATVMKVVNSDYDTVIRTLTTQVKSGKLTSAPITLNAQNGIRFEGTFSEGLKGSMVVFKIRDKTLQLSTQADANLSDFNEIILKTLTFNP